MFENVISSNAALWPDRPALIMDDQRFSYFRMSRDIGSCARWLGALDLPVAGCALICVPHAYVHWVLTFALERRGLRSGSVVQRSELPAMAGRLRADVIFVTGACDPDPKRPIHQIDQAWFDRLSAYEPDTTRASPAQAEDPVRYLVTSGTTGLAKAVLLNRRAVDASMVNPTLTPELHRPEARVAASVTINSLGGWIGALWAWMEGGTFNILTDQRGFQQIMTTDGLDVIVLAPTHLQDLLSSLPEGFPLAPDLMAAIIGRTVSEKLADRCRSRLTANIVSTYGSTETGIAAIGRVDAMETPEAAGKVSPWAEFIVLDETGQVLPPGAVGEIRFRTDYACTAYAFEEGPSEMFQDGWFCPGDLGTVSATGEVKVLGRTNDLMHIGGAKFLAPLLDRVAMTFAGVLDAATFTAPDADGLDVPFVAAVLSPDADPAGLSAALSAAMTRQVRVLAVDAIPRNAMGKIERRKLRNLVPDPQVRATPIPPGFPAV